MRRHRWLLVLGFVLVASGCSGTQLMGVSLQEDGSLEVRSSCTNEGLTDATIRTDPGGRIGFVEAIDRQPQAVIVFPADVLAGLEPADVITIDGDYGGTDFFGEPVTIRFGDLEPGTVVLTGLDPEVVSAEEFEDRRVRCGFSSTSLALLIAFVFGGVVLAAVVVAAPIVAVLLYLRRRRRTVTTF
ncbi:MAG: hypothetical protein AAF081_18160 [Actinomycetota bacterium]